MSIPYTFPSCATLFLSLAITSITAAIASESINGRVHSVDHDTAQVCFDRDATPPASGDEFTVIRHVIVTTAKSPPVIRSQEVGTLRIAAAQGEGCAKAILVNGNVQALDWVATRVHR